MSAWESVHAIGPVLALYIGAAVVFLADIATPRRAPLRSLSLLALLVAALYTAWHAAAGDAAVAFDGAIVIDEFSLFFAFLLIAVTAAVVLVSAEWASKSDSATEFYGLLLVSAGSMVLLAQGNDLIMIFVALETTSIAQFVLAGIGRDDRSSEAGLKYLLTSAVSAAVLLYGFAFLFGLAGTTSLDGIAAFVAAGNEDVRLGLILAFVLMAAGFGFKMAIVPFQAWVPDVYQGSPTPVTTYLSV